MTEYMNAFKKACSDLQEITNKATSGNVVTRPAEQFKKAVDAVTIAITAFNTDKVSFEPAEFKTVMDQIRVAKENARTLDVPREELKSAVTKLQELKPEEKKPAYMVW